MIIDSHNNAFPSYIFLEIVFSGIRVTERLKASNIYIQNGEAKILAMAKINFVQDLTLTLLIRLCLTSQ